MALADLRQIVLNLTQEARTAFEQGNLEDSNFLIDRARSVADLGQKFKALLRSMTMNQELRKQIRQTCAEFDQTVEELRKLEVTIKHRLERKKDQN